jgi:hypothetical protein
MLALAAVLAALNVVCVVEAAALGLFVLTFGSGEECPPATTSAVQTDPLRLPDDVTALGVADARYVYVEQCDEYRVEGFVTLDPAAAETLRTRFSWQPAQAPRFDGALFLYAPAEPDWQQSEAWDMHSSRPGWMGFLRDARSGGVYFWNASGD